jgi:hypothetical protein
MIKDWAALWQRAAQKKRVVAVRSNFITQRRPHTIISDPATGRVIARTWRCAARDLTIVELNFALTPELLGLRAHKTFRDGKTRLYFRVVRS